MDGYTLSPPGVRKWKKYRVRLDGSFGWKKLIPGGAVPASDDDLKCVLSSITDLRIAGEFSLDRDEGCLNSVRFGKE